MSRHILKLKNNCIKKDYNRNFKICGMKGINRKQDCARTKMPKGLMFSWHETETISLSSLLLISNKEESNFKDSHLKFLIEIDY